MELIVISDPAEVADEAAIINALFSSGMKRFHFRKPDWDGPRCEEFLEAVEERYHPAIVLHQHHGSAARFGIKGLHFNRMRREMTPPSHWQELKAGGYTLSTSLHFLGEKDAASAFDYAFFSPVFASISKPGYGGSLPAGFHLEAGTSPPRLFALGGVNADNLPEVRRMNFDGAAVLGTLWKQPNRAVEHFIRLKQRLEQINDDR